MSKYLSGPSIDEMDELIRPVISAWTDEGPVPAYHEMVKEKVRRLWPILANALDELVEGMD